MVVPFANAAAAYAGTAARATKGAMGAGETEGGSFGQMLEQATKDGINTLKQGEQKSVEGALGKADLTDVVNAVTNAEVTLQAVISVRDRVVSAYQEIMRMPM